MLPIKTNKHLSHGVNLTGGLNLLTTSNRPDGHCVQLLNYEINALGNYQSVTGFERFDGQLSPSSAKAPNGPYLDDDSELADLQAERDRRRSLIMPVPGRGPVRGIFMLSGVVYAFRDDLNGEQCRLYQSTLSGWQVVATPVLLPGGRYQFRPLRWVSRGRVPEIVGVDGKNKAFVFDGNTFTQIANAGMAENDTPVALEVLPSEIILMAYPNGSLQFTTQLDWQALADQGEVAVASDVIAIDAQANDVTAVFCRNRTYLLYGRSAADFRLTDLSTDTGAVDGTVQTIGDSVYLDDRGLTRLSRVQQFGNFDMTTFSQFVEPLLGKYRSRVLASVVIREKNQYRLFFDDGTGLIARFSGQTLQGFTTFDFGKYISCTCNAEDEEGTEQVFIGDHDGYVYQLERGTSFDGAPIVTVMRPVFSACRRPAIRKKFFKLDIEAVATSRVALRVQPDFDYSAPEIAEHQLIEVPVIGGGGYWDQAIFNETFWSAASLFRAQVRISGRGTELSPFIRSISAIAAPHIISGLTYHFSAQSWRK